MKLSQAARKAFKAAGKEGGHARAAKLTADERSAIAKRAATARWQKREEKTA